jgi:hypothetical protein
MTTGRINQVTTVCDGIRFPPKKKETA